MGKTHGLSMIKEIRKEVFTLQVTLVLTALSLNVVEIQSNSYSDQRKVMHEPEQFEFPKKLQEFGYHFNDAGELRTIEGDNAFTFAVRETDYNYNQQHYEALGNAVTEEINTMMEKQYRLQKSYLPVDADANETRSYVFISGDLYTNNDKMMILIHGSGAVSAGQWSRRLIINDNIEKGSQLPFIKWARDNGYSVIVANTNLNFVDEKKKKPVPIRGNGTPEEHVESLWREFVQRSPAKNIVIVAHSYGGVCAASLCMNHIREFEDRVFSIVLTDSVHGLRKKPQDQELIDFFKERAMNWASAYDPLDAPLHTPRSQCPTISAGTDVHELTSYTSMGSIFKYIPIKYDQKMNPEKYKQEQEEQEKTPEEANTETFTDNLINLVDETQDSGTEAANQDLTNQMKDVQIAQDSSPALATANEKTAEVQIAQDSSPALATANAKTAEVQIAQDSSPALATANEKTAETTSDWEKFEPVDNKTPESPAKVEVVDENNVKTEDVKVEL